MVERPRIWLVTNALSGSNDERALAALRQECDGADWQMVRHTLFPEEEAPSPEQLDADRIDWLLIFAGDGTLNAVIDGLAGWGGAVLVLPGGTMNLLYHRLFGDLSWQDAVCQVASGEAVRRRPGIIRCSGGSAYAGVLAGPGTAWYDVREAMRVHDFLEVAQGTRDAIEESFAGDCIMCSDPELGRSEGYPLIVLKPEDRGIFIKAYHAEGMGEILEQAFALMRRDFREGPHDDLGSAQTLTLSSVARRPFGLLLDGEPADESPSGTFMLASAPVDLLATVPHD